MKTKSLIIVLIASLLLTGCGGWTTATQDETSCDPGKVQKDSYGDLEISSSDGNAATIWTSYNGESCGETLGSLENGKQVEWFQIVGNAEGQLFVNVSFDGENGWVNCSDLSFTGDMEYYLDQLSDEGFDLYLECVNISKL